MVRRFRYRGCGPEWRYYLWMRKLALAVLLLASVSVLADDSALVAMAKRTHRAASKTPVITNDTLAASKGRISVASGTASAPAPSSYTPPSTSAPQHAGVAVAPNKLAPTYDNFTVPQAVAGTAPQSSVRNTPVESTARSEAPSSSARTIQPESTARNIDPESTVRNADKILPQQQPKQ